MNKKVSIILVNYNGWKDTIECLKSLHEIDYLDFEVIIVDNGSSDNSAQKIEEFLCSFNKKLIVNTYELSDNYGFSVGNNVGIHEVLKDNEVFEDNSDYILLLNNDTVVKEDFLTELVKAAESDNQIGIVGSKIYFYEPRINADRNADKREYTNKDISENQRSSQRESATIWFNGGKINRLKNKGTHIDYKKIEHEKSPTSYKLQATSYITGCSMLIKKEVIEKIGYLDDDYFLYYEDADFCLRAREAGFKIIIAPESILWHKASASTNEGSSSYVYYHARNGLMFAHRFGNIFTKTIVDLLTLWTVFKQIIKLAIPSKRKWAKAVLRGLRDFYAGKFGKLCEVGPRTVVGVDCKSLEGKPTGVGTYLRNLLIQIAEVQSPKFPVQSRIKFILYFRNEIPKDILLLDPLIFKTKIVSSKFGRKSNAFFTHFDLAKAAKKDKVNVLFCPEYISPFFYSGKTALTLHDIFYEARPKEFSWPSVADKFLLKYTSKRSAKKAALIITPSEFSKREVIKYYKINPKKIAVIPHGLDKYFLESQNNAKSPMEVQPPYIFYVGSIFNRRHIPELITAFFEIAAEFPEYQLVLGGKNHTNPRVDIENIIKKANEKLGAERIIYFDYIPKENLPSLYQNADLFVYLSDYEGFGFPLLEAASCGVPVMTADIPPSREVLGECGIFVKNPADVEEIKKSLYTGLSDTKLREHLIYCGVERARQFSWQKSAEKHLKYLLKV